MTDFEREYQEVNAKFNAILNATVDAIILINQEGIIERFNAAAEHMFGYTSEEILGANVKTLMPETYGRHHDAYIQNYLDTGRAKIIGVGREVRARRANGEIFPIELSVGKIEPSSENEPLHFVGIIRDITARVDAESEAKETRERLAHVTRLSTMGEMASGIAHEINQPLAAIATYAQACKNLIPRACEPSAESQRLLDVTEKISAQAMLAGEVIRRLRDFIRKRAGQRELVEINPLIQETLDMARADTRLLDHGIELDLAINPPKVLIDSVQIQQVLLNLIRNAIDATDDQLGVPIRITSQVVEQNTRSETARNVIKIQVIDWGHGIQKSMREHLFDPFYTTKASGMGMGLAISQSIIKSHGGTLKQEPNPDACGESGCIFSFTIPAAETHSLNNETQYA